MYKAFYFEPLFEDLLTKMALYVNDYFEKRKVVNKEPKPTVRGDGRIYWEDLGEVIPINSDGDKTND